MAAVGATLKTEEGGWIFCKTRGEGGAQCRACHRTVHEAWFYYTAARPLVSILTVCADCAEEGAL